MRKGSYQRLSHRVRSESIPETKRDARRRASKSASKPHQTILSDILFTGEESERALLDTKKMQIGI